MNSYQDSDLTPLIVASHNTDKHKCKLTYSILLKASLILSQRIKGLDDCTKFVARDEILKNGLLAYMPINWSLETVISEYIRNNFGVLDDLNQYYIHPVLFKSMHMNIISDLSSITFTFCNNENPIVEKIGAITLSLETLETSLIRNYFTDMSETELQAVHKFRKEINGEIKTALQDDQSELHKAGMNYVTILSDTVFEISSLTPNESKVKEDLLLMGQIYTLFFNQKAH